LRRAVFLAVRAVPLRFAERFPFTAARFFVERPAFFAAVVRVARWRVVRPEAFFVDRGDFFLAVFFLTMLPASCDAATL
jgi:hypothetical protein